MCHPGLRWLPQDRAAHARSCLVDPAVGEAELSFKVVIALVVDPIAKGVGVDV